MAFSHYGYDRVEHYFWGWDARLFRPMFFFILGTMKYLFHYDFVLWQVTVFVFHLFVQWHLLKLLARFGSLVLGGCLTLWFSSLIAGIEMVTWHHIGPYLIFVSLILMALDCIFEIIQSQKITSKKLIKLTLFLLIACFIYEIGCILGGIFFLSIMALYFRFKKEGKELPPVMMAFCVLLPSIFYVFTYFFDLYIRKTDFIQAVDTADAFDILKTMKAFFFTLWWMIYTGNFAAFVDIKVLQRTIFKVTGFHQFQYFMNLTTLLKVYMIAVLSLWVSGLWMIVGSIVKGALKKRWLFLLILFSAVFIQIFIIIIGRTNLSGLLPTLINNSYYGYFVWIYLVVLIGFLTAEYWRTLNKFNPAKIITAFLIFGIVGVNGKIVYDANKQRAHNEKIRYHLIKQVRVLEKEFGENFSFGIQPIMSPPMTWVKPKTGKGEKEFKYLELLYPRQFDFFNPQYVFVLTPDGTIMRGKRY